MLDREYEVMYNVEDRHWWYLGMHRIFLGMLTKFLAANLSKRPQLAILDAGCGTGKMMERLSKYGKVTGIDYSELALSYCRRRGLADLQQGSITELPFVDQTFDVITCFDVLYHLNVKSDDAALREFYRVSKSQGLVLINVPAFEFLKSEHDISVQTRKRYTRAELKHKVELAGFKIRKITYLNFLAFPLAFALRMLKKFPLFASADRSELTLPGVIMNSIFLAMLMIEGSVINYIDLPIGLSVFCVAEKAQDDLKDTSL